MSELTPKFQQPDFSEDDVAFTIASDIPTKPYDEVSLEEPVGDRTMRERLDESFGKYGWTLLAATGVVVVLKAGQSYYENRFGKEE